MYIFKKVIKYIIQKIKYRGKVTFFFSSNIGRDSSFEGGNLIQKAASFSGEMGFGSYIAKGSSINGKIGRFTSIGPYVRCNTGIHPYTYPFVSSSPWFYSRDPLKLSGRGPYFLLQDSFNEYKLVDDKKGYAIEVGNDCWIGEGAFFIGGIKINDGAVVLAHAVVTKDVPPYAIVGGVPAKIVGYRFSEDDIKRFLEIKWWNKDIEWICKNVELFRDIPQFQHVCSRDFRNLKV